MALQALSPWLTRVDRRAAIGADSHLANSTNIQHQVREVYGVDSIVVHPPHSIDPTAPAKPIDGLEPGYLLCVCRLLPYKHVGKVVDAMRQLPAERLVIVGSGPLDAQLRHRAGGNVAFLHDVTDGELRWLYANSRLLVTASQEDYGLTPVEAAAFGVPSVVLRWGGFLDTVVDGETGLFFESPTAPAIVASIRDALSHRWKAESIRRHSKQFGVPNFRRLLFRALGIREADVAASP